MHRGNQLKTARRVAIGLNVRGLTEPRAQSKTPSTREEILILGRGRGPGLTSLLGNMTLRAEVYPRWLRPYSGQASRAEQNDICARD